MWDRAGWKSEEVGAGMVHSSSEHSYICIKAPTSKLVNAEHADSLVKPIFHLSPFWHFRHHPPREPASVFRVQNKTGVVKWILMCHGSALMHVEKRWRSLSTLRVHCDCRFTPKGIHEGRERFKSMWKYLKKLKNKKSCPARLKNKFFGKSEWRKVLFFFHCKWCVQQILLGEYFQRIYRTEWTASVYTLGDGNFNLSWSCRVSENCTEKGEAEESAVCTFSNELQDWLQTVTNS